MDKKHTPTETDIKKYPGMADDIADDETVDTRLVKQAVRLDNNNPRDNGE